MQPIGVYVLTEIIRFSLLPNSSPPLSYALNKPDSGSPFVSETSTTSLYLGIQDPAHAFVSDIPVAPRSPSSSDNRE